MVLRKCAFAVIFVGGSLLSASADPRKDFADCIERTTFKALESRPTVAQFKHAVDGACRLEELAFLDDVPIKSESLRNYPNAIAANAKIRASLNEKYIAETRKFSLEFYSKWYKNH